MVDWEKGQYYERQQWFNKVNSLIGKIEKGSRQTYNKQSFIDILKKYLLEEEC